MKLSGKQLFALAAVAGSGLLVSAGVGAATLNIIGCDSFTGDIATGTITCVPSPTTPPAPGAPSGCTASATPLSLSSAGGAVSLTGSCTTGTVAATTWKRNGTTVSAPDTAPGNSGSSAASYSYTATFCANSDGTLCTTVSAGTVTVAAGVTAPPPTVGSCADQKLEVVTPYLETNRTVTTLTFDGARAVTQGFTGYNVVVATIRVPEGLSGGTTVTVLEYTNPATSRRMWIAKSPCDFSNEKFPYYTSGTTKLPLWFGAGGDPSKYVVMQPGETWYVMVRNQSVGYFGVTNTCKSGECNIAMKIY